MRILHVIAGVGLRDGGPSVAIRGMTEALVAAGHEVTVATTDSDGAGSLDVPLGQPVMQAGVEYRYFRRNLPGSWKFSWPLTRWLWQHVPRFDVVHVHALFSYSTIPACRTARRRGVPYVMRPLGTLDPWGLGQRAWKKAPYLRLVERSHLDHAAAIHVTSEAEAAALASLGYASTTRIIPLGVPVPAAVPRLREAAAPVRLLFLSRLHPVKGLPLLLEAMRRLPSDLPEWRLTIAGRGEGSYGAEMQELARDLGLGERVTFCGAVEGEEKEKLLRRADVFVLPSQSESFGIAVAEAMAYSLPVIVSRDVALGREVESARAGLVVPREADALAAAIARLVRNPVEGGAMGGRGRALVEERFSWAAAASSLQTLYSGIARPRLELGRRDDALATPPRIA
ncbi:MAG: hypothetical protein JWO05_2012 [Gemmatimonadetes bacterium]|nr:hypothetical protein [Gemmatimonadota bacterium]